MGVQRLIQAVFKKKKKKCIFWGVNKWSVSEEMKQEGQNGPEALTWISFT